MAYPDDLKAKRPKYMRPAEAARFLGVSISTLKRYREMDGFPAGIMLSSRAIIFSAAELEAWIESKKRS
jgi:predicted DNA-binding transcriptional regulator AlpA